MLGAILGHGLFKQVVRIHQLTAIAVVTPQGKVKVIRRCAIVLLQDIYTAQETRRRPLEDGLARGNADMTALHCKEFLPSINFSAAYIAD